MDRLIIEWSQTPTYTTIMGVFAGSSLISVSNLGKNLLEKKLNPVGWTLNFAALGLALLITGAHMTLTWPLKGLPLDNIVFGETSLGLGILDIALALYLWKRGASFQESNMPLQVASKELSPFRTLLTAFGFGIAGIACAGFKYMFFIAPKEEPIGGDIALLHPIAENIVISSMFLFAGISALLTVLFLSDFRKEKPSLRWYHKLNYILLQITGWFFLVCGAIVYYTHIGLIMHTMK